jgi:hypothetical protein
MGNGRKQGAPRATKHRHLDSRTSSSGFSNSISLSATAIRTRKTKDATTRNAQYAGDLFTIPYLLKPYLCYSHDS